MYDTTTVLPPGALTCMHSRWKNFLQHGVPGVLADVRVAIGCMQMAHWVRAVPTNRKRRRRRFSS